MDEQNLYEQEINAWGKYYRYYLNEKFLKAIYWYKKFEKLSKKRKKLEALIKQNIRLKDNKTLNTTKI